VEGERLAAAIAAENRRELAGRKLHRQLRHELPAAGGNCERLRGEPYAAADRGGARV
jgi:hypothetical protein